MKNETDYYSTDESINRLLSNSVSVSEQETNILYMRDQDYSEIYTSDSTQMTRMDKLCKKKSRRAKKKEMSEKQRLATGERMKVYQANKNS